jgi:hypothetical protein
MNYTKIYKNLMERAKLENRKKGGAVYYESHHIMPDFMYKDRKRKGPRGHLSGNPNDPKNLVLLTEREHILSHILLAKSLKGKRYWAQAASALVWFYTKVGGGHIRQKNRLAGSMRKYERYRSLGLAGISKSRKGTMPVKDAITGIMMGSVSTKHPKVLSGEWVHHSKGKVVPDNEMGVGTQYYGVGAANNNYKEMTTERRERVLRLVQNSIVDGKYLKISLLQTNMKKEFTEFNLISLAWIKNNFVNYIELVNESNLMFSTNYAYNPHYRSQSQKKGSSGRAKLQNRNKKT